MKKNLKPKNDQKTATLNNTVKVRLDWTRSNAKQREATVGDLREWLLIFATGRFIG